MLNHEYLTNKFKSNPHNVPKQHPYCKMFICIVCEGEEGWVWSLRPLLSEEE